MDLKNSLFPYPLWTQLILEVAPSLGMQVEILEPRAGYLVKLKKGNRSKLFLADTNPLNSHVASRISRDKAYTKMVLQEADLPVPLGDYFFFPQTFRRVSYDQGKSIPEALSYSQKKGFPLVLKPNTLSMGKFVDLVENLQELKEKIEIMRKNLPTEKAFILEEWVPGRELRVILLDNRLLLALEKKPFSVYGNGKNTLLELALAKWRSFGMKEEDQVVENWKKWASQKGYHFDSIVPAHTEIILEPLKMNLHQGAQAEEIENLPSSVLAVCQKALSALGLRYGGLDLKWDGQQVKAILEVNSNAGFLRYGKTSSKRMEKAKKLVGEILKALF